jgi:hypothetical protein
MAFDISTARPESSGFDISTARPEQQALPPVDQKFQELTQAGVPEQVARREAQRLTLERAPTAERLRGSVEAGTTLATSIAAEPVSGLAGLVATPFVGAERSGDVVRGTREALTFTPRTEAGREQLQAVGETLEPVAEVIETAEKGLGDAVFEATDSPALAAIATSLPTLALEALGVGTGRKVVKASTGLKETPKLSQLNKVKPKQVESALVEAAPDVDKIKDASRAIYKEMDDIGVNLKDGAFKSFTGSILGLKKKLRINKRRTPEAFGVLEEFRKDFDSPSGRTVTDMEDLRRIAGDLSASATPAEARIGARMLDEIDDFMDRLPSGAFEGLPAGQTIEVGNRYRAARNLWGRARRAELISDAMSKAERQATGFENGIRNQLRQILNNKKRSRFFTKEELTAMDAVVKGTTEQNVFKLIGRLGFSEGQATNILGGLGGTALGGAIGGQAGAAAIPFIGQLSRKAAQRSTVKNAKLSDAIVRARNNGKQITEAYLRLTPKGKRSISELSDILTDPSVNIDGLVDSSNRLIKEAAEMAKGRRAFLVSQSAGAAAPLAIQGEQ